MLGAGVSVLVGGAYLGERFATTREDLDGRMKHWSASLDVLAWPADWVFGKGLGRYPASYFYHVPDTGLPGSFTRAQVMQAYGEATERDVSNAAYYYAFGLFKVAVIAQQIYARHVQGLTSDPRFAGLGRVVAALGESALRVTESRQV